jgi:hypothetical protein
MTEPDTMPAGAEMDDAVGRRVMGWTRLEDRAQDPTLPTTYGWTTTNSGGRPGTPIRGSVHWQPSTKIAHAWEVMEWLFYRGCDPSLMGDDGPGGWWCQCKGGIEAFNADVRLAICYAALAALGSREGKPMAAPMKWIE